MAEYVPPPPDGCKHIALGALGVFLVLCLALFDLIVAPPKRRTPL